MAIQLYLVSFLELLFPLVGLFVLYRFHKFRFAAVIGGVAAYYLASEILLSLATMMMSVVGMDETYWDVHENASQIVNVVLNSIFHDVTLYLILRFTLKNRAKVYDAMALGISYWLSSAVLNAVSNAYYAHILQANANGTLSSMVNDSVTLDMLTSTVSDITSAGLSNYYIQLAAIIAMSAVSAAICLFFYLSIRRKAIQYFLLAMLIHLAVMIIVNMPILYNNMILYLAANTAALIAAGIVIWRFMLWYKARQKALAYRRKHYQAQDSADASEAGKNNAGDSGSASNT